MSPLNYFWVPLAFWCLCGSKQTSKELLSDIQNFTSKGLSHCSQIQEPIATMRMLIASAQRHIWFILGPMFKDLSRTLHPSVYSITFSQAKITKCGHIYCWPCILHYLSLGEKKWAQVPHLLRGSDGKWPKEVNSSSLYTSPTLILIPHILIGTSPEYCWAGVCGKCVSIIKFNPQRFALWYRLGIQIGSVNPPTYLLVILCLHMWLAESMWFDFLVSKYRVSSFLMLYPVGNLALHSLFNN